MKKINLFSGTENIYNLACTPMDLPGTDTSLMGCRLAPGAQSEAHNHFEHEVFLFTAGNGYVEQNTERLPVRAGDAVLFERFQNHVITNASSNEELRFHSIYWPGDKIAGQNVPDETKPAIVFSTPPTPNGDLHLGHLSGPYLAADVLTRSLRDQGRNVCHITGRDDNQTYVLTCGQKEGRSPEATATHYDGLLRDTWARFDIGLDGHISPYSTPQYAGFLRHGITRLEELGLIERRVEAAAFDLSGNYLHEAYISGECPSCGAGSDGNACEACGRPNSCTDLVNARDRENNTEIRIKDTERLYFRLSAFEQQLSQYVKTASMPASVAALSLGMIEDGLPDICISHPGPWGMNHDIPGFEDHKIYVWFEMAFGYLWGAAGCPDVVPEHVMALARAAYDGATDIFHCYGFDNAYYHTLLFPAVHMALGLSPAGTHVVNQLLDLDGEKFSTSRRHLIWGRDFAAALPQDYARFALMLNRPEDVRENFVLADVQNELDRLFADTLAGWLDRFTARLSSRQNILPEPGAWLADQTAFHNFLLVQFETARDQTAFSPRRMARILREIIVEADRFSRGQAPLLDAAQSGTGNYARTALALEALALSVLAQVSSALMPGLSASLSAMLGTQHTDGCGFLPAGQVLRSDQRPELPRTPADLAERITLPSQLQTVIAAQ